MHYKFNKMTKLRRILVFMPELILIFSVLILGVFIVYYNPESFLDCWTLSNKHDAFKSIQKLKEKYPDYKNGIGTLYNMADYFKWTIYFGFAISIFHLVIVLIIILFCRYL